MLRSMYHLYSRAGRQGSAARVTLLIILGAALALPGLGLSLTDAIAVTAGEVAIEADGQCALIEAIENANDTTNGQPHADCAAGNPTGADVITLPAGSIFRLANVFKETEFGPNGLPWISTAITLNGNGATILRQGSGPEMRVLAVGAKGDLTLNNVTVQGGWVSAFGGDGIFNQGKLTVRDSRIVSNNGEGIQNIGESTRDAALTIISSTLSYNAAYAVRTRYGQAQIVNSTLSGNGGGVLNDRDSVMTLTNSTLTRNSVANQGGGVNNFRGVVILERSLISGNSAPVGAEVHNSNGVISAAAGNVLGHAGLTTAQAYNDFTPSADDYNAAADARNTALDAILSPTLADNGGPTATHSLPPGSPAIDRASSGDCVAAPVSGKDQRGLPRNRDGDNKASGNECDAGAVEAQSAPTPTPTPTATPRPNTWTARLPFVTYTKPPFVGPFEVEPNNSGDQANGSILPGRAYFGRPNDNNDFYYVDLSFTSDLTVSMSNHTGLAPQLQVFFNVANADHRVGYDTLPPFGITLENQPPGRYYIFVYTAGLFNETSAYTLLMTAKPAEP